MCFFFNEDGFFPINVEKIQKKKKFLLQFRNKDNDYKRMHAFIFDFFWLLNV